MAEKAQAEPTMEEILASIRKIIADDGERIQGSHEDEEKNTPVSVNVSDDDDFEDLSLDDVLESSEDEDEPHAVEASEEMSSVGGEEDDFLSDVDDDIFKDLAASESEDEDDASDEEDDTIESLESFDLEPVDLGSDSPVEEPVAPVEESFDTDEEAWDTGATLDPFEPEPEPSDKPAATDFAEMETAALRGKTESTPPTGEGLTDERIAGAAASALGKLMVKQSEEAGNANPNTLEGLMMELLRPMIKEWLDANLPAIVERKVEEEVQRIARMAR